MRTLLASAALGLALFALVGAPLGGAASATEPTLDEGNLCPSPGGQGEVCATQSDCALNTYATICVEHVAGDPFSRTCEIPCETQVDGVLSIQRQACAVGETCRETKATPGRKAFYCKPTRFRVDLNVLDQCVAHHLSGLEPVFAPNTCSLAANLARLLDQNGDNVFNIFDLDLCVSAFLEQPGCDLSAPAGQPPCDSPDLVRCDPNAAVNPCGEGLYCDANRNTCQRDCGIVGSREPEIEELERQCSGNLKVCDYRFGRCETVDVSASTCEIDLDCPSGAYCLLGRCAPSCYRAVDCPGTGWYCTQNNRCRALPHPAANEAFVFDPRNYAVRFTRDSLRLDGVQNTERAELFILDLVTKRRVVNNPSVSFGYRMETTYGLKLDRQCLKPFVACEVAEARPPGESEAQCNARQDDCFVDSKTESWIRALSPFGTIAAAGNTAIEIALDEAIADELSAGTYQATVRVIFDNGDSDSIPVTLVKASPSGEYAGRTTVYMRDPANPLNASRPLTFEMRLKLTETSEQWNTLMEANNLDAGDDIVDITSGKVVVGQLHGNAAMAFTRGGLLTTGPDDNEIPFIGLYSPDLGRIRMIGVIDIPAGFCVGEDGPCTATSDELQVKNLFGRDIRRQIEFIGPFDPATARFSGIYREKVSGLAADYDITLEGGFIMDQTLADASALELPGPIVAEGDEPPGYPDNNEVIAEINGRVAAYCTTEDGLQARAAFASKGVFESYIAAVKRRDPANNTAGNVLGRTTIFPALQQFSAIIDQALVGLGQDVADQQKHLNIYDFVSSRLLPCDPNDPSPPPVCVDEDAVRCGLALHQLAIMKGWVDIDAVEGAVDSPVTGEQELFCVDTIGVAGCPDVPGDATDLFALQEHNRFWRDLGQILKFDGDRARSDAFLVLFRNELNPFAEGAALSFKADALRRAVARYDSLLETIVGTAAGKVLHLWPARAFKSAGNEWIRLMQTIVTDRMGAIAELVDLKRRVFLNSGDSDYLLAHHMMQQEYLIQVYLMSLQEHWQDELFVYKGEAAQVLEQGQAVLQQLNPARNAIGVQPGVVFFENGNPDRTNWQNYRDILVGEDGDGGLLQNARTEVDGAVTNLQAALSDLDTLEATLQQSRFGLNDTLADLCGDPDPGDPESAVYDDCQKLRKDETYAAGYEAWQNVLDCRFDYGLGDAVQDAIGALSGTDSQCPDHTGFGFTCEDLGDAKLIDGQRNCSNVVATLTGTGPDPPTCALDADEVWIDVHGAQRPCVGGEVGALIQEREVVNRERDQVVDEMEAVLGKMIALAAYDNAYQATVKASRDMQLTLKTTQLWLDYGVATTGDVANIALEIADAGDCVIGFVFIAGFSNGGGVITNCPQKAASKFARSIIAGVAAAAQAVMRGLSVDKELEAIETADDEDLYTARLANAQEITTLAQEINPLVGQLEVLSQRHFNMGLQIEDLRFKAQHAIDRFDDEVSFAANHLVGRESGYVLLGDHLVQEASKTFAEMLQYAYRMAVGFNHHFNVPAGLAATLEEQALALLTLDDVAAFVERLDNWARDYCGAEGIDCDWFSNVETLRFSVRDQLFPQLRDVIDGQTGTVVTAGEQFHNLITAPPYLKRRFRAAQIVDQIELPLPLPITVQENVAGGPSWLIDPLSCNHKLDARKPNDVSGIDLGTHAINVIGQNLGDASQGVRYQLARGGTDYVRACTPTSSQIEIGTTPVVTFPISTWSVGYAPQNPNAQLSTPAPHFTVGGPFTACTNFEEVGGELETAPCWRYFARDRSLASLDMRMLIPLRAGDANTANAWISGEGLADDQRPLIEDIVVYLRYRSRPVQEN